MILIPRSTGTTARLEHPYLRLRQSSPPMCWAMRESGHFYILPSTGAGQIVFSQERRGTGSSCRSEAGFPRWSPGAGTAAIHWFNCVNQCCCSLVAIALKNWFQPQQQSAPRYWEGGGKRGELVRNSSHQVIWNSTCIQLQWCKRVWNCWHSAPAPAIWIKWFDCQVLKNGNQISSWHICSTLYAIQDTKYILYVIVLVFVMDFVLV